MERAFWRELVDATEGEVGIVEVGGGESADGDLGAAFVEAVLLAVEPAGHLERSGPVADLHGERGDLRDVVVRVGIFDDDRLEDMPMVDGASGAVGLSV